MPVNDGYPMAPVPYNDRCHMLQRVLDELMNTLASVALLAPVPLVHLESGLKTFAREGRVAFGTLKWDLFHELDGLRKKMAVDVYIYASHAGGAHDGVVTWQAKYIGYERDKVNAACYRPESTASDTDKGEVFWMVETLRQLPADEQTPLVEFTGRDRKKPFGQAFQPRGPMLVKHPV